MRTLRILLLFFLLAAGIAGCRTPPAQTAQEQYAEGQQAYVRQDFPTAATNFEAILNGRETPANMIPQTLYWCSRTYLEMGDMVKSYRYGKRLCWDYPESIYTKYLRGRQVDLEATLQKADEVQRNRDSTGP